MDHLRTKYKEVCYTCSHCCCDSHDEDSPKAEFWCDLKKLVPCSKAEMLEKGCRDYEEVQP
jgi:hypothetical protein